MKQVTKKSAQPHLFCSTHEVGFLSPLVLKIWGTTHLRAHIKRVGVGSPASLSSYVFSPGALEHLSPVSSGPWSAGWQRATSSIMLLAWICLVLFLETWHGLLPSLLMCFPREHDFPYQEMRPQAPPAFALCSGLHPGLAWSRCDWHFGLMLLPLLWVQFMHSCRAYEMVQQHLTPFSQQSIMPREGPDVTPLTWKAQWHHCLHGAWDLRVQHALISLTITTIFQGGEKLPKQYLKMIHSLDKI